MRRLNHLDALRSGAMLIVVIWHLTFVWPTVDTLDDSTTAALEWVLNSLRWSLALFFLMAGFFGAKLLGRWGAMRFAKDRVRRIALPLAVGVVTVVPISETVFDWVYPGPAPELGLAHLWFLLYLLVLYALGVVTLRTPVAKPLRAPLMRLVSSPLALPGLAVVTFALLLVGRQLPLAESSSFVPRPALLAFYGSFFVVGLLLHGAPSGLDALGGRPKLSGAMAVATLIPLTLLDGGSVWEGPGALVSAPLSAAWLAVFCLFTWSAVSCACGLGRQLLAAERPAVRYVADSSYWIYLMHFPLLPLVVLAVLPLGLPFAVAWLVSLGLLVSVLLATYEHGVRHTFVGRTLGGPRPPRRWTLRSVARRLA